MRLVLYQPEIAGNVGAAIRAAACFGAGVDIVEPCGFPPDDRALKRAAMDYGALAAPVRHASWGAFLESAERAGGRLILLTTKADRTIHDVDWRETDLLLIGQESAGVPADIREACDGAARIPIMPEARSMNAAAAAAVALAEARRRSALIRRKPRLLFHIGHPKTATSYLQQTIALNAAALRDANINAPTRFRHIGHHDHETLAAMGKVTSGNAQAIFLSFEQGDGAVLDAYAPYADGERDLLLSSELFFYYPHFVRIVTDYFRKMDYMIEVFAYLPRYERALISGYVQNVRSLGFQGDIPTFVETTRNLRYLHFAAILEDIRQRSAPDRLVVRTFDERFLKHGDIVSDFADVAGLDLEAFALRPAGRVNETLPLEALEGLRRLRPNRHKRVAQLLQDWTAPSGGESERVFAHYYTPEVSDLIEREYARDRSALIAAWFADNSEEAAYWDERPPPGCAGALEPAAITATIHAARARRRRERLPAHVAAGEETSASSIEPSEGHA